MITRTALLMLVLVGCGGDQGFNDAADQTNAEEGTGVMVVTPSELVFSDLDWEQAISSSLVLKVENAGDNNLVLHQIGLTDSGGGVFHMEELQEQELAPGVSQEFAVVATLSEFASAEGEARILSNDGENRDLRIPLSAFPVGWQGGDTGSAGDDTGSAGDDTGSAGDDTGSAGDDTGSTPAR